MLPTWPTGRSTCTATPTASTARASGTRRCPTHAPDWIRRWRNPDADPGETQTYVVADRPPALAWVANFGALELHPWTSTIAAPARADVGADRHRPRRGDELRRRARCWPDCTARRSTTSASQGCPRSPGSAASRSGCRSPRLHLRRDPRAGSRRSRGRSARPCPSWSAGSGRWQRRGGRARLDYTQNAINKTLVAPFSTRPPPGARCRCRSRWDELDDDRLRPDRWTIRDVEQRLHDRRRPARAAHRRCNSNCRPCDTLAALPGKAPNDVGSHPSTRLSSVEGSSVGATSH